MLKPGEVESLLKLDYWRLEKSDLDNDSFKVLKGNMNVKEIHASYNLITDFHIV